MAHRQDRLPSHASSGQALIDYSLIVLMAAVLLAVVALTMGEPILAAAKAALHSFHPFHR